MVTSKPSGTNHPNPFRDASPPRHRTEPIGRVRKKAGEKNDKRRLLYGAVTKKRNGEDANLDKQSSKNCQKDNAFRTLFPTLYG